MSAPAKEDQAQDQRSGRGVYVYGIVPGDVEVTEDAQGVGDPPARVEVVSSGDLAALVSEIDTSKPLGRPEDLLAHQQLLDGTAPAAPVLPMRFGAVLDSKQSVVDELLAANHDELAKALSELEGKAQFVVKGRYVEDSLLREVLAENPDAARLRDQIKNVGDEAATRDLRIQLGEMINEAVAGKREADTRALGDAVAQVSIASSVREPSHEEDAANIAVLVEVAKQDELERAVSDLAGQWEGRISVRLLGPMAPYDFVTTPEG
jgi:Gas vesicle synthesis protein GvpL/GvpF